MDSKKQHSVNEPDIEYGRYTYADYLTWEMDEMVELIKGKVFKRCLKEILLRQGCLISGFLFTWLLNFILS
jgi:hypothetical protein